MAGVSVAGMDRTTAEAALRASLPALGDGEITLTVDGETVALPYASVARDYDLDAMLDAAFRSVAAAPSPSSRSIASGASSAAPACGRSPEYDRDLARRRLMVIAVDDGARPGRRQSSACREGSAFFRTAAGRRRPDASTSTATLAAIDPLLAATDAGGATVAGRDPAGRART